MIRRLRTNLFSLCLFVNVLFSSSSVSAQTVYQPLRHPVYDYLDRIEARYGIYLLQFFRPLPRTTIACALISLSRNELTLTPYDKKELQFYLREFSEEVNRISRDDTTMSRTEHERWNLIRISSKEPVNMYVSANLIGKAGYEKREDADDVVRRSNGIQVYGYVGENLGAYTRWYDNGLSGIAYDPRAFRTPDQAVVKGPGSEKSYEYEVAEGQISYSNNWLRIGLQKMDLWFGSGRFGSIILSDKAPSFPIFHFTVRLTDWLEFFYFHGWLFSDTLNSDKSYIPGPNRETVRFYQTKYLVSHALTARPIPNLQITAGESIIYSETGLNILFLIPVISFRAADRWTRAATGNSQFFADVRYTPLKGVTLYGTGYIDELDLSKVFASNKEDFDYQVAYTVGTLLVDSYWNVIHVPSETRIEFSRVYPFVYTDFNPAQQYTSHKAQLGHWIGSNADLVSIEHIVHPDRGIDIGFGFSLARFGNPDNELLFTQHPQPAYLWDYQYSMTTYSLSVRWIPIHDLSVNFFGKYRTLYSPSNYPLSQPKNQIIIGGSISFGIF